MNTRKNRPKRSKKETYEREDDGGEASSCSEDLDEVRKSRIRDCNKEFARRMTILTTWSDHWRDYQTREGEAYPLLKAKEIMKRSKKITCPIESCKKAFTSIGGLRYHYARCNIEKSFRCIVCDPPEQVNTRGELLRHMILNHYNELPPLNDDQRKIANSYLSCESRVEKARKDKKISADTEPPISAQRLIKAFCDIQTRVFTSNYFDDRPFRDWFSDDLEPITHEIQRMHYYPPESDSLKFKLSSSESWTSLKAGDSTKLCSDKRERTASLIFFTGGINTATAWLPKPPPQAHDEFKRDLIAVAVNCCSMDQSFTYRDSRDGEGCIQLWSVAEFVASNSPETKISNGASPKLCALDYMIAHEYGTIFEMLWCPLGTSYNPETKFGLSRAGLLALACGDGQVRIMSIPHTRQLVAKAQACSSLSSTSIIEAVPMFKTKPVAILLPPGIGPSTCQQAAACKSICWNLEDNQKLIVAGYANGNVAIFDLENSSPIIYLNSEGRHVYRPLKTWIAHGAPVTGVAMCGKTIQDMMIATGSIDRQLKIWNPSDPSTCLISDKAPITRILWDFRFRGIVSATDAAFTSFHNRVSYRYPVAEGNHSLTVSTHRSTVWGLDNSKVTNAIATSDGAGEVFILPQLVSRSALKRDRNFLGTHRLYSMVPRSLDDRCTAAVTEEPSSSTSPETNGVSTQDHVKVEIDQAGDEIAEQAAQQQEDEDGLEPGADFSKGERPVANKPTKFLLPIEHRPVETYSDFKVNYGLEFINYNPAPSKRDSTYQSESCIKANDIKDIHCDRPCDYPFSSIDALSWSPNIGNFQYLISSSHVGLCRVDRVQIVEQIYKGHIDSVTMISNRSEKS